MFAVRFVAHALNQIQHQLFGIELVLVELFFTRFGLGIGLLFDFRQNLGGIGIGRQLAHNHAPLAARQFFHFVTRPHPHAALAGFVEREQILVRCDDVAAAGKIGRGDVFHQIRRLQIRLFQQRNRGLGNFAQIVRRNFGGHTHRNARRAVE